MLHLQPATRWVGLTLALLTALSCSDAATLAKPDVTGAYNLMQISGDAQLAQAGRQLPGELVVRLMDRSGQGVAGIRTAFSVVSGGGLVAPATVATDRDGYARTSWTLGMTAGQQQAQASVAGIPALAFTATASLVAVEELARAVSVTPATYMFSAVGDSLRLSAIVSDSTGRPFQGATVHWTALDPKVATVDSTGIVVSRGSGNARVQASVGKVSGRASMQVQQVVAGVSMGAAADTLQLVGDTLRLSAIAVDRRGNPIPQVTQTWISLDPSVAAVDSAGLVLATGVGTTSVRAVAGAQYGSVTVAVRGRKSSPVARVVLAPSSTNLTGIGSTAQLTAFAYDASGAQLTGQQFKWSSGDASTASVNGVGVVTAKRAGATQIIAVAGGTSGSSAVTVVAPTGTAAKVVVTPSSPIIDGLGNTIQLTAVAYDQSNNALAGQTVTWTSGNAGVATVDANGVVKAIAIGTAQITATVNGVQGSVSVSVIQTSVAVSRVAIMPASVQLTGVGATAQLTASAYDGAGNPVSGQAFAWTSVNGAVATVSTTGLVTAQGAGTTQILATSGGVQGSSSIVVSVASAGSGECASPRSGWIWCDDFEQDRLSSYFEYDSASGGFTRAAAVGYNGSYGMRVHWTAGQVNAGALHLAFGRTPEAYMRAVDAGAANYRDLYWRVYLRNQSGWTGGGGDKLARGIVFARSDWSEAAVAHVWSGNGSTQNYITIDPASGTDSAGSVQTIGYNDAGHFRWLGAATSSTPIFDSQHVGVWQCVEAHMRLNSAGHSDGVFELWVNGNLEARSSGLNWVGSYSAYGINSLFLENYWNAGAPQAEERFLDDLVVSTQPIGCIGSPPAAPAVSRVVVNPSSAQLSGVGATAQLAAQAYDGTGNALTGQSYAWASSNAAVASVASNGLVTAKGAGTVTITATDAGGGVQGSAAVTVTVSSDTSRSGDPLPGSADAVLLDTRAGGAQSIQGASTWAAAIAASTLVDENNSHGTGAVINGVTVHDWEWAPNFDGKGTHAFQGNQTAVGCGDLGGYILYKTFPTSYKNITVQYKFWLSKNAADTSKTALGTPGSWTVEPNPACAPFTSNHGQHKRLLLMRTPINTRGDMIFTNGSTGATTQILIEGWLGTESDHYIDWAPEQHVNQVNTITMQVQAESSSGAHDGVIRLWINGQLVFQLTTASISTDTFYRMQLPSTVSDPQQYQTEYLWDVVAWTTPGGIR